MTESHHVKSGIHYATMVALVISNLTVLGLAILIAGPFFGGSLGYFAAVDEAARVKEVNAAVNVQKNLQLTFGHLQPVKPYLLSTIDTPADLVAMANGSDGLPAFVYRSISGTDNVLKFARCFDVSCTNSTKTTLVSEALGMAVPYLDITIDFENKPVIFFRTEYGEGSGINSMSRLIRCAKSDCSTFTVHVMPTLPLAEPESVSLSVSGDGLPALAYVDTSLNKLRILKCLTATCNSYVQNDITPTHGVYSAPSLKIAQMNKPVVSYYDAINKDIRVAFCDNASCQSSSSTPTSTATYIKSVVQNVTTANWDIRPSLALASSTATSTSPIISFNAPNTSALNAQHYLKIAICGDRCSTVSVKTLDGTSFTGLYNSLTIGSNFNPVVSYVNATTTSSGVFYAMPQDMMTAICTSSDCATQPPAVLNMVFDANTPMQSVVPHGIEIMPDGLPLIGFLEYTESGSLQTVSLKVLKCTKANCAK